MDISQRIGKQNYLLIYPLVRLIPIPILILILILILSPLTAERIRMACSDKITKLIIQDDEQRDQFRAKGSF